VVSVIKNHHAEKFDAGKVMDVWLPYQDKIAKTKGQKANVEVKRKLAAAIKGKSYDELKEPKS
jgi:hypothetical protein